MEVFELSDLEPITLNLGGGGGSSSNFGSGIELLMNEKNKSSSASTRIDLGELDKLENELNDLSSSNSQSESRSIGGFGASLFGMAAASEKRSDEPKLGQATVEGIGNTKTWDGFSKLNEVPVGGDDMNRSASMPEREKRRKKRAMLKNLEQWYEKGVLKGMSRLTMDSSYEEIEDEYEGALEDKRKRDSVKIQQNWLITMINTIEYGNSMFDPFGVSLDGWGESISEDIDSYGEIFEQLHEKYKGGKMSPELSLLLRLGFSASVVHFSNKALSTAAPGFNDVIKQSPELMRMFTNATVDSMKQSAPGMAFASELLNNQQRPSNPPPPAVDPRTYQKPAMQYTQRPDLSAGRGAMFREQGVELNGAASANESQQRSTRPEMSGPKNVDINNILSGLKTKTVNIENDDDSMISISSLKDMNGVNMPKKSSRRKNKSDKNTISLDI
jgi:hypothetical protein